MIETIYDLTLEILAHHGYEHLIAILSVGVWAGIFMAIGNMFDQVS